MLNAKNMAHSRRAESANTTVHIINRVYPKPLINRTPYEMSKGKKQKLSYLHVFSSKCYILNDREQLRKFDARSGECLFLGYSMNSHAHHVFNKRTGVVMESVNVAMDDIELNKECSKKISMEHDDSASDTEVQHNVEC